MDGETRRKLLRLSKVLKAQTGLTARILTKPFRRETGQRVGGAPLPPAPHGGERKALQSKLRACCGRTDKRRQETEADSGSGAVKHAENFISHIRVDLMELAGADEELVGSGGSASMTQVVLKGLSCPKCQLWYSRTINHWHRRLCRLDTALLPIRDFFFTFLNNFFVVLFFVIPPPRFHPQLGDRPIPSPATEQYSY